MVFPEYQATQRGWSGVTKHGHGSKTKQKAWESRLRSLWVRPCCSFKFGWSVSLTSDKLDSFILNVPNLHLGEEHPAIQDEDSDVGGHLAVIFFRLERHNDLVISTRDKLKGGEAVGGYLCAHVGKGNVREVGRGAQQDVGTALLVLLLAVPFFAGPSGKEEPAVQRITPCSRLVD